MIALGAVRTVGLVEPCGHALEQLLVLSLQDRIPRDRDRDRIAVVERVRVGSEELDGRHPFGGEPGGGEPAGHDPQDDPVAPLAGIGHVRVELGPVEGLILRLQEVPRDHR